MRYDIAYVALGAVVGASMRYLITSRPAFWGSLPLTVLTVNVLGSLVLGVTMAVAQKVGVGGAFVPLLGIGFCGSFTTMSSLAFESANLIDTGMLLTAAADVVLNMGLSILVIFAGRALILLALGGA